jgi:hypothetical protein
VGPDEIVSDGPLAPGLKIISVKTSEEAIAALQNAQPGDEINFDDGVYLFNDNLTLGSPGTSQQPVFVRAKNSLKAQLKFCNIEGFMVSHNAYWIFENLDIEGVCHLDSDSSNEHAFHITGNSDHVIIRNNHITNFKSHLLVNGSVPAGATTGLTPTVPADLWILNNQWRDMVPIGGGVPHNALDIEGGSRALIRGNSFVDLVSTQMSLGPAISIYIRMSAQDFIVEKNFILCRKHIDLIGDRRGIESGDSDNNACNGDCANLRGLYRNNIVMNCDGSGNSGGLNLNNEKAARYLHNTLFANQYDYRTNTEGTDFTFISNILYNNWNPSGIVPTVLQDNVDLTAGTASQLWSTAANGDFSLKDGGAIQKKATQLSDAQYDICGHSRSATTDIGAIDYGHPRASDCVNFIKSWFDSL